MRTKLLLPLLALAVALLALVSASPASAKSSIRVGVADQSPAMFQSPFFQQLKIKRTRYFVPADIMSDPVELERATAFVTAARSAGVSTLIHISSADLRDKRGKVVSTTSYRSLVKKLISHFRKLGVRDFGAWNEVNHKTQETWNRIGNAVSYFKSMYSALRSSCKTCALVGLDMLDQAGADRYMRSFYARLSPTWRTRLKVVGIHNYSDVNRTRSTGTAKIINTARRYNKRTKFWFTETGALASFQASFPYSESRQASRMKNMFSFATRYKSKGVERVYSYNFFGINNGDTNCGRTCQFDAGLVDPDGTPRPVFSVFKQRASAFSR